MKLIRFGGPGKEKPGVLLNDGTRVDASGFASDYDEAFFGNDGLAALRRSDRHLKPCVDRNFSLEKLRHRTTGLSGFDGGIEFRLARAGNLS